MNTPENPFDRSSNLKLDQSLLLIFVAEAGKLTKELLKNLDVILSDSHDPHSLDRLNRCVQEIVQGAKIVRLNPLIDTGQALSNYLNEVKQGKMSWSEAAESCFRKLATFLNELSSIPVAQLDLFVQERSSFLARIRQTIRSIAERRKESSFVKKPPSEKKAAASFVEDSLIDGKMYDLFRYELEGQSTLLTQGLIELEKKPKDPSLLESLMRNAHSVKGAARVIALNPIVRMAHAMEDCFVKAQNDQLEMSADVVDLLFEGVDVLIQLSRLELEEVNSWIIAHLPSIEQIVQQLALQGKTPFPSEASPLSPQEDSKPPSYPASDQAASREPVKPFQVAFTHDKVIRITAQHLNHLMALAGESLIESRWLYPFGETLQKFKRGFRKIESTLTALRNNAKGSSLNEATERMLYELHDQLHTANLELSEHIGELENFIGRFSSLSDRLFQEVINSRMRPFADVVEGFPRMVRDLARHLGKKVRLEISGESTQVDRDVLEKLESPLSLLLRNAVDHGIELPDARSKAGKPEDGVIKLEAKHRGGMLVITVSDDGRGMDIEHLKKVLVEKKIINSDSVEMLTDSEVLNFLFLPGFSTSSDVSEISGRGVGLDIVKSFVQEVGGRVWISFEQGKETHFHLQLPVTLSVIRSLLVEISGESYSLPLAKIDQSLQVDRRDIETIGHRQFIHYNGQNIELLEAWQILELPEPPMQMDRIPTIILSDGTNRYGFVVDRFLGEKELVVREIDRRLGKIPDIIVSSLMEDGSPVLMIDVEEIVRSMDHFLTRQNGGVLKAIKEQKPRLCKRVLVVDDSITVREMETRLLEKKGYWVDSAINGMDGWNAVRSGNYDLIVTDVDMPRMSGIELLTAIKNDSVLSKTPVMIVSYKSSEEERLKGLEAGADYYLTKSSFHDTTLIEAVADLIGDP